MRALVDLLVPPLCDGCDAVAAPPWCAACDDEARRARPRAPCSRCAGPDTPGHACWAPGSPVSTVTAYTTWQDPIARAVVHAKLAGRAEVFRAVGPRLAEMVTARSDVVVPVPTDPRRARQRGRDHTGVLAAATARALDVPVSRALRVSRAVADRGAVAVGDRPVLPPDAMVVTRAVAGLEGRRALIVDDLVTTGATLAMCGRALLAAGVERVDALVIARAGQHLLGA